jgi:hypothetical protein
VGSVFSEDDFFIEQIEILKAQAYVSNLQGLSFNVLLVVYFHIYPVFPFSLAYFPFRE